MTCFFHLTLNPGYHSISIQIYLILFEPCQVCHCMLKHYSLWMFKFFQVFTIINNVTSFLYIFAYSYAKLFVGWLSRIAGLLTIFRDSVKLCSKKWYGYIFFYQQCLRVPLFPHSHHAAYYEVKMSSNLRHDFNLHLFNYDYIVLKKLALCFRC